jgi:hypothetical protein
MGAVLSLGLAGTVWAQQQQFGQPGTYVTWGAPPPNATIIDVTYFIAPGAGFTANETSLIQKAANAWSTVGGGVRLVQVGTAAGANVNISFAAVGSYGQTTLTTVPGVGTYPNGDPWVRITGASAQFNSGFSWWDGTGTISGGEHDFYSAALDLLGQSLGLGFAANTDGTSVMQKTIPANSVGNESLSPSDIAAVQAIYGSPEPPTLALLGVGLLVIGLGRYRL